MYRSGSGVGCKCSGYLELFKGTKSFSLSFGSDCLSLIFDIKGVLKVILIESVTVI